jgi:hypothetical protein
MTMRTISPTLHGLLDYTFAGLFFALPRLMGWRGRAARLLTGAALAATAYSLLTNYRFGAARLLPVPLHLAADGALNGLLVGAALHADEETAAGPTLVTLGLVGLAITLRTDPGGSPRGEP